ncbi:MAG: lamin tail domain-containing protein, partial [Candidatus Cloacimonetes bacterium]|nr:lamin tail domain-containing protein [Candidatus Cloacimonadota bacterium]
TLLYSTGGPVQSVAMTLVSGDDYSVQIGPFGEATRLEIAVEAEDTALQTVVFPAAPGPDAHHAWVSDAHYADGDVVVNEIQYTDACYGGLDWVELVNTTGAAVDLSFWFLRDNQDDHVFQFPAGTSIAAGEYLVVAQNAAEIVSNYGISNVVGDVADGLSSAGDAVRLYDVNDALVDQVYYEVTAPWPGAPVGTGPSLSLMDAALDNADGSNWEASAASCGTPGSSNDLDSFAPAVTQAGIYNGDRVRVFFNEDLDPASQALATNYLLDGSPASSVTLLDGSSVELDFGTTFAQGVSVSLDVSGVSDLAGNVMTAASFVLSWWPTNAVVINEIMQNPLAVTDEFGEWIELYNPNLYSVNLRGWVLKDDGTDSHTISPEADLLIAPGAYLVLGSNSDTGLNGGAPVSWAWGSEFALGNGTDEVVLVAGLTEIDRVAYDNGATFPDPNGFSMELIDVVSDNAVGANWMTAQTVYGAGDHGTPGAANSVSAPEAPMVSIVSSAGQVTLSWDPMPRAS